MLYGTSSRSLITEAASAEFLDPEVSEEVKDTVNDLQDAMENIEEVDPDDKETNNAVLTAESCPVYRIREGYAVDIRDIIRICEADEEAGDPEAEPADAGDVASDVAQANDVSEEELVIVAPVDVAQEMIESALFEAKCGGKSKKGKKKVKSLGDAIKDLTAKGFKVKKKGSKKKK